MALLAVLSIGAATYYATAAVTAQAEAELRRGLDEAGTLVEQYRTPAARPLQPRSAPGRGPTQAQGRGRRQRSADASADRRGLPEAARRRFLPGHRPARARAGAHRARPEPNGILQVVSVPITIGEEHPSSSVR